MGFSEQLGADFAQALEFGTTVRFRYFTTSYAGAGSSYDDDVGLVQSGNDLYISGVVMPFNNSRTAQMRSSTDAVRQEQGEILTADKVLYVAGSISTSGDLKIGIGSPVTADHSILPEGVTEWGVQGTPVYKRVFLRNLPTGSLIGE